MFVKCIVWLLGGRVFNSGELNKRQFTVFHGIGPDFQTQRKKSKLFSTNALTSAFVYDVTCIERLQSWVLF